MFTTTLLNRENISLESKTKSSKISTNIYTQNVKTKKLTQYHCVTPRSQWFKINGKRG